LIAAGRKNTRVNRLNHGARKFERSRFTAVERRIVYTLIAVIPITIFQSTAFHQVYNVGSIWIQHHVALELGGYRIPVPWFLSVNSVFRFLDVPLVLTNAYARRFEPRLECHAHATNTHGSGASNNGSMPTVPVNQSAGPLSDAIEATLPISIRSGFSFFSFSAFQFFSCDSFIACREDKPPTKDAGPESGARKSWR
jgi:hypothetical protein